MSVFYIVLIFSIFYLNFKNMSKIKLLACDCFLARLGLLSCNNNVFFFVFNSMTNYIEVRWFDWTIQTMFFSSLFFCHTGKIMIIYCCRATYLDVLRARLEQINFHSDPQNLFIRQMYSSPYGDGTVAYRNNPLCERSFLSAMFFLFCEICWEINFVSVTSINNLNAEDESILSSFWEKMFLLFSYLPGYIATDLQYGL